MYVTMQHVQVHVDKGSHIIERIKTQHVHTYIHA